MDNESIADKSVFSRTDYYRILVEKNGKASKDALSYALRRDLADGIIVHVGRDQYSYPQGKKVYSYHYSDESTRISEEIHLHYAEVDFQIFELTQLNAFVNHLIARNSIFVFVENDAIDYVFDTLRNIYPGQIMLKPSVDDYYRYLVDNQIVLGRLPSETPTGIPEPWMSRLEKILVDISVDKLLSRIVSESEYDSIFHEAFDRYILDLKAMLRYANRKGASTKFRSILNRHSDIILEE